MEKNSNKGLKKLILLLLLFVGLGASVTAGAYWASSFTANNPTDATGDLTVTIGEGKPYALKTTLAFGTQSGDTTLPLVPTKYAIEGLSTNRRDISIGGVWSVVNEGEYTLGSATGTLSAVINSYSLGTLSTAQINEMFTISVTTNNVDIAFGSSQQIVVSVVFREEPATKTLYDIVANGTLTINITLSVVAKSITITGDSSGSVNDSIALTAVLSANLTGETVWTSSDKTLATVTDDGVVTLLSAGTVTITAENGGIKTTHKIAIIE